MRSFFLLVAALSFGILPVIAQSDKPSAPPERVVRDFYQWYLRALVAKKEPLTDSRAELKRSVTARLLRQIEKARAGDGLGADPFLDAQDFDDAWAKKIKVAPPVLSGQGAVAEVELKGPEMGTQKLRVTLVEEKSGWKIDKVEGR